MGAFHPQHVRAAPGHRIGHAAGHRGRWRRSAVPLDDHLSCRACAAAVRAAYDPAQAPRLRADHPGTTNDHPELPAVGTFGAGPAAEYRFGGTFTERAAAYSAESEPERFTSSQFAAKHEPPAKPERVVNVAVPEPDFTGSDRLRQPATISQDVCSRAATPGSLPNLLGTGSNGPLASSESERPGEVVTHVAPKHLSLPQRPSCPARAHSCGASRCPAPASCRGRCGRWQVHQGTSSRRFREGHVRPVLPLGGGARNPQRH